MVETAPMEVRIEATIARFESQLERAKRTLDRQSEKMGQRAKFLDDTLSRTGSKFGSGLASNAQNAAYQIQDFAVQVASGQSAVTALAQQLPQMLGGLGLIGAAAGAAVAILAGLWRALGNGEDAATSFAKALRESEQASDASKAAAAALANDLESLAEKYGLVTTRIRELKTEQAREARVEEERAGGKVFEKTLERLRAQIGELLDARKQIEDALANPDPLTRSQQLLTAELAVPNAIQRIGDTLGLAGEQVEAFAVAVERYAAAGADGFEEQAAALDQMLDLLGGVDGVITGLPPEVEEFAKWLRAAQDRAEALAGTTDRIAVATGAVVTEVMRLSGAYVEALASAQKLADLGQPGMWAPYNNSVLNPDLSQDFGFQLSPQDAPPPPPKPKTGGTRAPKTDELAQVIEQIEKQTLALERQAFVEGMTARQRAEYMARAQLYDAAIKSNTDSAGKFTEVTDEQRKAIETAVQMIGEATAALEAKQAAEEAATKAAEEAAEAEERKSQAIADGIDRMTQAIGSARSLEDALRNVAVAALEMSAQGLFGGTGPLGGLMNNLLGVASGGLFGMFATPAAPAVAPGLSLPPLYDSGGYTGDGGKMEPAGIVHRGEYVFDAAAVKRIGVGNLERMRKAPGYASGGLVARMPVPPSLPRFGSTPSLAPARTAATATSPAAPVVTINVDARGAQQGVAQQIERTMTGVTRNLTRIIQQRQAEGR